MRLPAARADIRVRTSHPRVRDVRSSRAALAEIGREADDGEGGSTAEEPCGFFEYMFEGVYVDE